MNTNLTEIIIIQDRSRSMVAVWDDVPGAYEEFVKQQLDVPGDCRLTFVAFDDRYDVLYEGVPLQEAVKFPQIGPGGYTALNDAIGRTLNAVGERLANTDESERPGKVIVVIYTDGKENASQEFSTERIREMIEHQTETYSWEFMYMGANQDSFAVARNLGISRAGTSDMKHTGDGIRFASAASSDRIAQLRGGLVPEDLAKIYENKSAVSSS